MASSCLARSHPGAAPIRLNPCLGHQPAVCDHAVAGGAMEHPRAVQEVEALAPLTGSERKLGRSSPALGQALDQRLAGCGCVPAQPLPHASPELAPSSKSVSPGNRSCTLKPPFSPSSAIEGSKGQLHLREQAKVNAALALIATTHMLPMLVQTSPAKA